MKRLEVVQGDITRLEVDVIVNAANQALLGGGGVDGAIHAAAGPELLAACRALPELAPGVRCPTGEARITPAFRLHAKYVVHTVGPVWQGGDRDEPALLSACYRRALALSLAHAARTIAFPAISTGVFGFPLGEASLIAARECWAFLKQNPEFEQVSLVAFRSSDAEVLRRAVLAGSSA